MPTKEPAPRHLPVRVSSVARGIFWTLVAAAAWIGLAHLHQGNVLGEQQLLLMLFLAVPIGAFLLSGAGQDVPEEEEIETEARGR